MPKFSDEEVTAAMPKAAIKLINCYQLLPKQEEAIKGFVTRKVAT